MAATLATHTISSNPLRSPYVAVLPGRPALRAVPRPAARPVRAGRPAGPLVRAPQPSHTVYLRRRVLVALVLAVLGCSVWVGAGQVLAGRAPVAGGPAAVAAAPAGSSVYVAHDGDTMWSIAARFHGDLGQVEYVNQLIELNGGSFIRTGQAVVLP